MPVVNASLMSYAASARLISLFPVFIAKALTPDGLSLFSLHTARAVTAATAAALWVAIVALLVAPLVALPVDTRLY